MNKFNWIKVVIYEIKRNVMKEFIWPDKRKWIVTFSENAQVKVAFIPFLIV